MAAIDATIITLALVPIEQDLHTDYITIMWVILGYLLVNTALVLSFGRMADLFGRKNMYLLGFIIFTVGSALCGFATSGIELVIMRIIQGTGGAFLIANSLAIVTEAFPPKERGKAFGFNAIVWSLGSITGVALGGLIISFVSWRWIFYINIPIGIFGTIWGFITLKQDKKAKEKENFDLPAALSFTIFLLFLLIGITLNLLNNWTSLFGYILIIISPAFFAIFVIWESKFSKTPIIPLSYFKNRVFTFSIITALLQALALFSVNFLLVFYFEGVTGLTPFQSAILIIPMSLGTAIIGPFAGRWSDKFGARVVATAGLLIQLAMLIVLTGLTVNSPIWIIAIIEAAFGVGGGSFYPANTSTVMSASPPGKYGVTSGILVTFRNTGMILSFVLALVAVTTTIPANFVYQLFVGTVSSGLPTSVAVSYLTGQKAAFTLSYILVILSAFFSIIRGKLVHAEKSHQISPAIEPKN